MWQRRPSSPSYLRDPLPQNAESQMRTPLGNQREIHMDTNGFGLCECFLPHLMPQLGSQALMCECNWPSPNVTIGSLCWLTQNLYGRSGCFICLYSSHPIAVTSRHLHKHFPFTSGFSLIWGLGHLLPLRVSGHSIGKHACFDARYFRVTFKVHQLLNNFSPALAGHTTTAGCHLWK